MIKRSIMTLLCLLLSHACEYLCGEDPYEEVMSHFAYRTELLHSMNDL